MTCDGTPGNDSAGKNAAAGAELRMVTTSTAVELLTPRRRDVAVIIPQDRFAATEEVYKGLQVL
jgi:hypothetical protein